MTGLEPVTFGSVDRRPDSVTPKDTKELRELESGEVPTMVPTPLHVGSLVDSSPPSDPDLARLLAVWPGLPHAIKAGILAMVEAARSPDA